MIVVNKNMTLSCSTRENLALRSSHYSLRCLVALLSVILHSLIQGLTFNHFSDFFLSMILHFIDFIFGIPGVDLKTLRRLEFLVFEKIFCPCD